MLIIREMTINDVEQVHQIEEESFSTPWTKSAFVDELNHNLSYYIVAEYNDNVIAYAGLWQVLDEGHITNIAVDSNYRGKGIGYNLASALLCEGKKRGINSFTLEVRKSNIAAINLYKKIGFNEEGIRKNYYHKPIEDALIMWY